MFVSASTIILSFINISKLFLFVFDKTFFVGGFLGGGMKVSAKMWLKQTRSTIELLPFNYFLTYTENDSSIYCLLTYIP